MRQLAGQPFGHGRMAPLFEPGTAEGEVVGQETRERVHLGHGQQAARMHRGEHPGEDEVGICHVVQGRGRPRQVHGAGGRPPHVQVGLDGADPVGHAEIAGLAGEAVQQWRGPVHGDHLGPLETLGQGEGARSGSAPEVEDPASGQAGRQLVHPVHHFGQVGVQYLGIEFQKLGHGRRVGLGRGMVMVFHAPTLRAACATDITSCV